ncbi:glycosyltransferase family 4 protein, partial [Candidatus Pelagibacter sp.]|nr:glycosyltransferase family 4 protein [Candidatus Pelagibacter sp.]
MNIAILLPYKEDYSPRYAGAVSIHVSNLLKYSKFKNSTVVYGNTNKKVYLSNNFINIKVNSNILFSNNKKYLEKFVELNKEYNPDIIEIHNRPSYVNIIKNNLKSKIILYFHNNPLTISGSRSKLERIKLLEECEFIFFNSVWTQNQFFKEINPENYKSKFGVCFQSTKKMKINIKKKENIISFVGKLNSAKGYDIFGQAIIKILNEFPDWKSIVVGDEPREKLVFLHKNLKIYNFKENSFVLNLLKKTSIFVACSRWEEPFGRSSLEASSLACATIITNKGGLSETTKHPIIIKKLDANILYNQIKKLIKNLKLRKKFQILNYKSFFLSHEYVSKIIDKIRTNILEHIRVNKFNFNNNSKLKIIHVTNFNQRYFGRLQYNTGIRLNNGLIRLGHNVISLSDRDIINYSKSFKDPTGGKYLNNLISETINNFKPDLLILGHADKINNETLLEAKSKHSALTITQWFLDPISRKGPDYQKNKARILDKIDSMDATFATTDPESLDFKINNSFFIPNPCDKSLDNLKNFNHSPKNDV